MLLPPGSYGFSDPNLEYVYTQGELGFNNPNEDGMDACTSGPNDAEDCGRAET